MSTCTLHLCTIMHQVLVEGKRPNLVPPMRPLTDLRKLLLTVKRSLPMSPEVPYSSKSCVGVGVGGGVGGGGEVSTTTLTLTLSTVGEGGAARGGA